MRRDEATGGAVGGSSAGQEQGCPQTLGCRHPAADSQPPARREDVLLFKAPLSGLSQQPEQSLPRQGARQLASPQSCPAGVLPPAPLPSPLPVSSGSLPFLLHPCLPQYVSCPSNAILESVPNQHTTTLLPLRASAFPSVKWGQSQWTPPWSCCWTPESVDPEPM